MLNGLLKCLCDILIGWMTKGGNFFAFLSQNPVSSSDRSDI